MTEIKVIGDILSGKYQPVLTGNPVVDAALINHFCQNLVVALKLPAVTVQAEHHWDLTVDSNNIYVVDAQILHLRQHLSSKGNVIAVSHTDILRGNVQPTIRQLVPLLTQSLAK